MLRSLIDEHPRNERTEPNRPQPAELGDADVRVLAPRTAIQDQSFLDVARVLYRRRLMILTASVLGAMLAALVGLAIPPKYTAVAQLVVEPPQGSSGGRALSPAEEININTHIAMLSSRDQMARVLDSLSSGAAARTAPSADIVSPSVGDGAADDAITNPARGLSPTELTRRLKLWTGFRGQSDARLNVEQLERNASITQLGRSRVIRVGITSKNPQQAATLANRVAQIYADAQYAQNRSWMNAELTRLDQRISDLKNEAEGTRSAAQILMNLIRRQDEIRGQIEFISSDISVFSLAQAPERPSSSNPLLFILPALIICAIGASLFAVMADRLDCGLRSERDVSAALGIPCIGLVPKIARRSRARPHRYLLAQPFSAYSEAIRSAAASLDIVAKSEDARIVLISSSIPMEGRTTLALSLATYVSGLGRRVLLVDLDFRRRSLLGRLCRRTASETRDLHLQNRPPAEFIQPVPGLGLDYLPMPRGADPLEPFASEQIPQLLEQFRDRYDCVIIDGPPLLGITEARLLPALADKVLFVVKWGQSREVVRNAVRLLRDAGCPEKEWSELPTAIVTQVDLKQHARYRFGDAGELMVKHRKYYAHAARAWRVAARVRAASSSPRPGNDR
ncbi:Lipopolysaccharide biosynthesis protein [Bosea sp. LC85]|uniref:Wzz/FepE/Etk N-terminal domain-containing protein n=1 Tax=Bosea sp. LC85 TaxID=1502851 RepID=UPI0004E343A2|nr:Wzz/FepE/Etk N-terminal domain-containing protein [Bosea sp. LC85]KFC70979.1 Lipopolysaccharide biosynthesis protein [Bosea sp. LC85]